MSGTMLAGLLAAVLIGPAAESPRYIVQIDHTFVRYVEGEPEPEAQFLCQVEVVSGGDGSFDSRAQIGRETIELSGDIADAVDGKQRVEVQYVFLAEQGNNSPPEILGLRTRVELSPGDSVVVGGRESRTTDTVEGVTRTQVRRDSVTLSMRSASGAGNLRRIDAFLP